MMFAGPPGIALSIYNVCDLMSAKLITPISINTVCKSVFPNRFSAPTSPAFINHKGKNGLMYYEGHC